MIPQQLTLKNFLSYREATLDFRGLHTACICGPNGAGKSSLLEALAWALWGQSRATSEDDIIHLGMSEAQVDFVFQSRQQTYRVIRTRPRGQSSTLEFQVWTPNGFRSLTERGVRATQQLILDHLKLDYETFVNSSYLRQGRADEFMLKRPSERKQILADLLKLDQYDDLAEQAKDLSRQFKGQIELLERNLESIQGELQQGEAIATEKATLEAIIAELQAQQQQDQAQVQILQAQQQQRRVWQQQLTWQEQNQRNLTQDCKRLQQELTVTQQQLQDLEGLLRQANQITAGYRQFQELQVQEEALSAKFQAHQLAQTQRQQLQQQLDRQVNEWKGHLQQAQAQMEALVQQQQELQQTLGKTADVEVALEHLRQARERLGELDQLQAKVAPLLQRRVNLQNQLDRARDRVTIRLTELQTAIHNLQAQHAKQPDLQQHVMEVAEKIDYLEKRRNYQQRVREKGLERRSFLERLQAHQRDYETQLAELDQKLQMLQQPDAACPLCDRPLDEHHWNLVQTKHKTQQQDILELLWVVREQLVVSEREIQILRQEYRDLERELGQYNSVLERRGQLQEQLQSTSESQTHLQTLLQEKAHLEECLETGAYAIAVQEEMALLEQNLQELSVRSDGSVLPYDERDHALARGEVERWRWSEIKQAELRQAQKRQEQLAIRQPELQTQIDTYQQHLAAIPDSPLQQQIDACDRQIQALDYNLEHHNSLRIALRQAQSWQLRHQELQQAQHQHPQLQARTAELKESLQTRSQDLHAIATQIQDLTHHLQQTPDRSSDLQTLEQQLQQRRAHLDTQLSDLGRLQQHQEQVEALKTQQETVNAQIQNARRQYRVYQELSQAFGKNGIQALMIENVLPQLEAETNQILARLSANQLHVQFITQRAGRGKSSAKANTTKLIDTLDILIADARGTRPYETYSGGEAFRVNFAIRLALARLLAQRSGTALQMLIIDEGFGSQDAEGCDRLIAAINAIAPDFACILTVTHMPHFKAAFQARIEISKTDQGSCLSLSI